MAGEASKDEEKEVWEHEQREVWSSFVESHRFNVFIGVCIVVNALTMGMELDANNPKDEVAGQPVDKGNWWLIENLFCVIFLGELLCRLHFHRLKYFSTIPNTFDAFLVVIGVVDTWILTPILGGQTGQIGVASGVLRFFRVFRLARLVRLVKIFKELWLAIIVLQRSMRAMMFIMILIIILVYVSAMFTTLVIGKNDELFDEYYKQSNGWDHEKYFGTVPRSMLTLFQVVTLDDWSEHIARHVMEKLPLMVLFFIGLIAVVTFGLLNLIVGVIVETTFVCGREDKEKQEKTRLAKEKKALLNLRELFVSMDTDHSGTLDIGEVKEALKLNDVYEKLRMVEFPVDEPEIIFELLDVQKTGELTIDEFLHGSQKMKGQGQSKDVYAVRMAISQLKDTFADFEDEVDEINNKVACLEDAMRTVFQQAEQIFRPRDAARRKNTKEQRAPPEETPVNRHSAIEDETANGFDWDDQEGADWEDDEEVENGDNEVWEEEYEEDGPESHK